MNLIDRGQGVPVIIVPGIQGRWEWHRPGIEALARHCRVLTFAYTDQTEKSSNSRSCIDDYCEQIAEAMESAGLSAAVLCGISYGGLVAAVFAARHPERVTALVLASALPPTWTPDRRVASYLRFPRLMMPFFMLASLRLFTEIRRASPGFGPALVMALRHGCNAVTHMFHPTSMARRAATIPSGGFAADVASIGAPTLVIVGERKLDRVVPVASTLEYARLVPQARVVTLERTGHLGCVTRPDAFAELVWSFARDSAVLHQTAAMNPSRAAESARRRFA